MTATSQFTIEDGSYALDGGSIHLSFRDDDGVKHAIVLVQHRIPMGQSDTRIPGSLYLDDQIVEARSDEEMRLMAAIKTASISPIRAKRQKPKEETGPMAVLSEDIADFLSAAETSAQAAIQHLVDSLVEFVESEEYVRLAARFESDDSG